MDVQCIKLLVERVILHNKNQDSIKEGTISKVFLLFKHQAVIGENEFLLNDYLNKGNWEKISDKKVEAMRLTMPETIGVDANGVVFYVDFMEWLEEAKKKYEEQNFLVSFGEKFKKKFLDTFKA